MRFSLDLYSSGFTPMRFNIGFTPGLSQGARRRGHTPTINHAAAPFIENKRYWIKPRAIGDVVNRKADSVYQTDAVLILAGDVQGHSKRALPKNSFNKTKQYRVRRCSKACLLRCLPAHV
jgi:hypothetical protein